MSTLKSSAEDLTLNADGSGNDIILQSNGSNVGTLTAEGVLTATSFAGSGASLTGIYGKQTIWIPAAAITPTVGDGCAGRTQVQTTIGRPDMDVLDFDASSTELAQFSVAFPKSWNLGTVTYQVYWTTTATDTDGVAWGLQAVSFPDNESIDAVYGSIVNIIDNVQGAAEELYVTAESSALTIAGTPADDDLCFFRIQRSVGNASDDMAEDARLIGIKLFYTTDALNDA